MKSAAQVRQEREQKMATMTEEEKESFHEEEKLEKKQEWAKKQVENTTIVNCPQRNKVHGVPWYHVINSSLVWAGVRFFREAVDKSCGLFIWKIKSGFVRRRRRGRRSSRKVGVRHTVGVHGVRDWRWCDIMETYTFLQKTAVIRCSERSRYIGRGVGKENKDQQKKQTWAKGQG